MNCESSVGPVRREMHVLYVPLTPMVTTRVLEELTRPPVVEEAWTAPVQSGVPAGRRTRVSPGDAKLPRTLRVICEFGATVEGENPTSGGDGGGDGGGNGGGDGGGGDGGGGDGGGGDGDGYEHTRQPLPYPPAPSEDHWIVPGPKMKLEGPPPPENAVNVPDGWLGMRRKSQRSSP